MGYIKQEKKRINEKIVSNIKRLLLEKRVSRHDLAVWMNKTLSYIDTVLLNANSDLRVSHLVIVAYYLKVKVTDFFK